MYDRTALALIEEVLELPDGTLKGTESLASLNWDSLSVMNLIALANDQLGIILSPARIADCQQVADLTGLLARKAA